MIKWLFFDVGSTLIDESRAYEHRIRDMIAGSSVGYRQFCDVMLSFYRRNLKGDLEAARQFGFSVPPWHTEDERLYPEAKRCLDALYRKYHIGVIANQNPGTTQRLEAFGILQYIDLVVASAEEKLSKPDPRIFLLALERAGCAPEEAVMIGDRLDNDIAPAKALGMKAVWVRQGFGGLSDVRLAERQPDWITEDLDGVARIFV